ncbi:hypothetical protein V2J09_007624 [Rumex salicifolius]
MVAVFLFIYLTYKLRVFHCIFCCIFKTTWTCCSTCLCTCCHCCHCLFHELAAVRRRPRRAHMIPVYDECSSSIRFGNRTRRRHGRRNLIRSSLKPTSHRVRIGIRRKNEIAGGRISKRRRGFVGSDVRQGVRVTRTTKFAHKGLRKKW